MMKRYWKIVAALLVILIAGGGIGYSLGIRKSQQRHRNMGKPEGWSMMMMRRLDQELDLTDEQKTAIRPMLRETGATLHQHRREAMMKSWEVIRGFYEQLETHLSAEQVEQLKTSRQRIKERLQNSGGRPGRPGMRPPGPPPRDKAPKS